MPFSKRSKRDVLRRRVQEFLAPVDEVPTRAAVWVGHVALAVLIVSGEAIRWVDTRDTLISASTLRAVHVLAGFALVIALGMRVADRAIRAAEALAAKRRVRLRIPAFHWQHLGAAFWFDAAWWGVLGLLVFSGLERYAQLRHGTSVLPWLSPSLGWALHRPVLPYLYALLLINALIRGRLAVRRALSYLYTP
jgi:hypothetical protein